MINIPIVTQKNNFSCGEAVITSLLQYHNCKIPRFTFSSEIDGTSPRTIEHQLRLQGFYVVSGNFGWELTKHYIRKNIPIIVCMDGHWQIIVGIESRSVVIMNPSHDKYVTMSIIKFKQRWLDYDSVGVAYKNWGIAARIML
jgi:ABC-type bacteriocin/lantibiotic exporter with double-glycine peptidase domain